MKNIFSALVGLTMLVFVTSASAQNKEPDMAALSEAGFVMGPGSASYPVNAAWRQATEIMQFTTTFDTVVREIEAVVCGPEQNKGVLIVGEPDNFYRYIFARLATRPGSPCAGMWHVEVDINKIESGHKYVGEVDEYWREKILEPSDSKNVVLYFASLGGLIGLGSHSNDSTGIEREYASDISSGKLRTVAFMDKFDYNETIRSKDAYVLESFAQKLILPPVEMMQAAELIRGYMAVLYPHLKLEDKELNYLLKSSQFYMPNRNEPDRSLSIVNKLVREAGEGSRETKRNTVAIETAHPYLPNTTLSWMVEYASAQEIQLGFESFDLENNYDVLVVKNAKGETLETLTGSRGAFTTKFYPTNKLILEFHADNSGSNPGFKISSVTEGRYKEHKFTMGEVRNAVMSLAQVPAWLIDRDYSVIKNLRAAFDSDVIGVTEGKDDLVRLAKNGYVAGRTDEKPIGTIMFAGPTGTGKSYIAKKMAEFTGQKLITLDMTSYKEPSSFKTFQEVMARNLTNSPYAVYLFEEIDKASIEVLDQLYFMMDEGIFYDRYQRPLFARGAFLILTTNAASDTILNNPKAPDLRRLVMNDLEKNFRMSFLNRFDAISIFLPFSPDEYRQLAVTLANKKMKLIKEFYDWTMTVDSATYDYLGVRGQSPKFGARPMERLVENVLGTGIAEYQLENGAVPDKAVISLKKLSGEHAFQINVNSKTVDFVVNPGNNSGVPFMHFSSMESHLTPLKQMPLSVFFEAHRDFED